MSQVPGWGRSNRTKRSRPEVDGSEDAESVQGGASSSTARAPDAQAPTTTVVPPKEYDKIAKRHGGFVEDRLDALRKLKNTPDIEAAIEEYSPTSQPPLTNSTMRTVLSDYLLNGTGTFHTAAGAFLNGQHAVPGSGASTSSHHLSAQHEDHPHQHLLHAIMAQGLRSQV
jgi:hypothetical protein